MKNSNTSKFAIDSAYSKRRKPLFILFGRTWHDPNSIQLLAISLFALALIYVVIKDPITDYFSAKASEIAEEYDLTATKLNLPAQSRFRISDEETVAVLNPDDCIIAADCITFDVAQKSKRLMILSNGTVELWSLNERDGRYRILRPNGYQVSSSENALEKTRYDN
jgi:hypothetical protein